MPSVSPPQLGLAFDARIEDVRLATGTFVSVGPRRTRVVAAGDGVLLPRNPS